MADFISPDYPYKTHMVKGSSGGANKKVEYVCETEPGTVNLTDAVWRVKRLYYDSSGFLTDVKWADGNRKFDNAANNPSALTYV